MISQLQYSLQHKSSRVVLVGQGNCFFPVHKEGRTMRNRKRGGGEGGGGGGGGGGG